MSAHLEFEDGRASVLLDHDSTLIMGVGRLAKLSLIWLMCSNCSFGPRPKENSDRRLLRRLATLLAETRTPQGSAPRQFLPAYCESISNRSSGLRQLHGRETQKYNQLFPARSLLFRADPKRVNHSVTPGHQDPGSESQHQTSIRLKILGQSSPKLDARALSWICEKKGGVGFCPYETNLR